MLQKPLLFFSSYAPLFAILAVRFNELWLVCACAGLAVFGVLSLLVVIWAHKRQDGAETTIKSIKTAGGEASAYLAGYLLPFVTVQEPKARDLIAYTLFLIVAGVVHARTSAIQVNPLLLLLGWRIVAITTQNDRAAFMITRQRLYPGDTVHTSRLGEDVLVEQKSPKDQRDA